MSKIIFTVTNLYSTGSGSYAEYKLNEHTCSIGDYGFKVGDVVEMHDYDGFAPSLIIVNGISIWNEHDRKLFWSKYDPDGSNLQNPYRKSRHLKSMDKSIFEKKKELEHRIFQLELLKRYMECFLAKQSFAVKIETSVFGQTTTQPIPFITGKHDTYKHCLNDSEDGKFIILQLQNRIDDLRSQFDKL